MSAVKRASRSYGARFTRAQGSVLASQFSGRWDETNMARDADGNIFIDQSRHLFLHLLDYLRAVRDESPHAPRVRPPSGGL